MTIDKRTLAIFAAGCFCGLLVGFLMNPGAATLIAQLIIMLVILVLFVSFWAIVAIGKMKMDEEEVNDGAASKTKK